MSGRGGRNNGHGGRRGRGGRNRGRGSNYVSASSLQKKGMCTALSNNVFDYGQKGSADQMRTSWEKLVQHVGANLGQDICNELQNRATVTIPEPAHTANVMTRHATHEVMVHAGQQRILTACRV